MDPQRYQQVYELFTRIRKTPWRSRGDLLDQACAGDAQLREEVAALLAADAAPQQLDAMEHFGIREALSDVHQRLAEQAAIDAAVPSVRIAGYEIQREIHRSGQGVIYEAVQLSTERRVAIKVLLEGQFASASARQRFHREVKLVAQLNHPNIISICQRGATTDGRQFYVMDHVAGLPINEHVRKHRLTLEDTLRLFATVCDAVQFAHSRDIIHGDLKPSNALVDSDGSPKLLDFGFARWLGTSAGPTVSLSRQVFSTVPYMPPEQTYASAEDIDARSDVYTLGVMLYEVLTGRFPYPVGGQLADAFKHIVETPPTPPAQAWSADAGIHGHPSRHLRAGHCPIDADLAAIVLKAIAKERERRYASAAALAQDLRRYLAGDPIETRRNSD